MIYLKIISNLHNYKEESLISHTKPNFQHEWKTLKTLKIKEESLKQIPSLVNFEEKFFKEQSKKWLNSQKLWKILNIKTKLSQLSIFEERLNLKNLKSLMK